MVRASVPMTPGEHRAARTCAAARGLTLAEWLREAASEAVRRQTLHGALRLEEGDHG